MGYNEGYCRCQVLTSLVGLLLVLCIIVARRVRNKYSPGPTLLRRSWVSRQGWRDGEKTGLTPSARQLLFSRSTLSSRFTHEEDLVLGLYVPVQMVWKPPIDPTSGFR